nr:MAG TPA: hypothetical protein [Caudoviricetes sp.]
MNPYVIYNILFRRFRHYIKINLFVNISFKRYLQIYLYIFNF